MAWEAPHLLPFVLLALLTSGSWEQQLQVLWKLEGETVSVRCYYSPQQDSKPKIWCRKTSAQTCTTLVTHPGLRHLRHFIQDAPRRRYFTVTMTALRERDSGVYRCGTNEYFGVSVLRTIQLVVSRAPTLPATRSARTSAWTSAISPVNGSPPGHWSIISSVTVVILLLLALTLLGTMYLCKARCRARAGEDKTRHIHDSSIHEYETTHRTGAAPRQRDSQLSWGSYRQMGSGEDPGDVYYASLTHLPSFGPEDSIYINTRPRPKPMPDPFLAVEYGSVTEH